MFFPHGAAGAVVFLGIRWSLNVRAPRRTIKTVDVARRSERNNNVSRPRVLYIIYISIIFILIFLKMVQYMDWWNSFDDNNNVKMCIYIIRLLKYSSYRNIYLSSFERIISSIHLIEIYTILFVQFIMTFCSFFITMLFLLD